MTLLFCQFSVGSTTDTKFITIDLCGGLTDVARSDFSPRVATSGSAERGHDGAEHGVYRDFPHAAKMTEMTVSLKTRATLEIQIEHSFRRRQWRSESRRGRAEENDDLCRERRRHVHKP